MYAYRTREGSLVFGANHITKLEDRVRFPVAGQEATFLMPVFEADGTPVGTASFKVTAAEKPTITVTTWGGHTNECVMSPGDRLTVRSKNGQVMGPIRPA